MAIQQLNLIEGVDLPYKKIQYFEGNKNEMNVVIACSSEKGKRALHSETIILTEAQKLELGDAITHQVYEYLKLNGLITGMDC